MEPITFEVKKYQTSSDFSASFSLQLVGSLPVHSLTTMSMLPWIVAEIRMLSTKSSKEEPTVSQIRLYVSPASLRCEPDTGKIQQWDPLIYSSLFEYKPQHVHKLIHNSHDPSYFACLIKDGAANQQSICYVFKADDQTKVPEIISSIRQAGKIARQEEFQNNLSDVEDPFAKKFEVLFCGRVTVAHKNAPPALIDECIEKFNRASCTKKSDFNSSSQQHETANNFGGFSFSNKFRSVFQPLVSEEEEKRPIRKSFSQPGLRSFAFKKDLQEGSHRSNSFVRSFEEDAISLNLKSQLIYGHSVVQPTDIAENRTMLFTIGQSEVYLISPDTKKVAIEKSFKEISFCSQGIRHVDHFGFICRESSENGGFHFVCYVFQCTDEALVDEIMMTLKQAFTVAAVQQTSKAQPQLCEGCPMQSLHKLCEKIEGLHPSKTKLELQKHLTTLNNQEQASVFEEVKKLKPRNDQKENELVISVLRNMYEEKQKDHVHVGEKQTSQPLAENAVNEVPSSAPRFRLDMLKNRAKRSLTESFESILSRGSKARGPLDSSGAVDLDSSMSSTLSSTSKEPPLCEKEKDRLPALPTGNTVKTSGSVGDVSSDADDSPVEQSVTLPQQSFRRRANTLSHLPTESQESLVPVETSPSVPQRKLMSDYESKHSPQAIGVDSPVRTRRHSWRQQIFLRVATPQKACDSPSRYDDYSELGELPPRSPLEPVCEDGPFGPVKEERKRTPRELRELWKKAIIQQILLLRMEKENQKLQASENNLQNRRLKLDYEEITPCLKDVTLIWEKMLSTPGRSKIKFDVEKIHSAVGQGVPRHHRGEIWKFLAEQYHLKHQFPSKQQSKDIPYKELLKQLTSQQHAILIDLGRTFPTHPYFSAQLGAGQLSLYNILKAYSLLDQEVGYCQGLSFVAGVLLLHMSEEDAFKMLKFLMFDIGLRKQYRPDMTILQIQMYQLSRLLHDYHRDLYNHLEEHEIGPSLYAAPWFLTMFASQFPLGFVARVFDMLFLQGSEAIFKVALSLLGSHKPLILQHENLETIVDFIKSTLPNLGLVQMEKTISQVFEMDIAKQLQAYEVEYHVLQDELIDSSLNDNQRLDKLEKANSSLRKQNFDLLEELQVANGKIQNLEATVELLLTNEGKLKQSILSLEQERAALLKAVEEMQKKIGVDRDGKPVLTRQEHMDADLHSQL
ncbi:TBC1 domain family member 1 isoform X5 [Falco biarmicus]|uniref:TBC1 domain family member 1 isoform X5 n=1 Tax=Falco rusticolus TaxID=120794 RepID=UPI0006B827C0|nr:TBC1 domain family member 1 isoform X5 [Falco rusticolus]XP_055573692.1 TBC1 domain family member 1 isoform X6 [Falco cherrug]XP_056207705.1 TBC1 domain family member 1 isoform X5 [Falco biarmicus]